jgi:hypothetical protein
MTIEAVRSFFMWCTIINVAIMLVSVAFLTLARDWVYAMNNRMFGISRPTFDVVAYSFLGLYKILIIVFCVVPFVALLIVG